MKPITAYFSSEQTIESTPTMQLPTAWEPQTHLFNFQFEEDELRSSVDNRSMWIPVNRKRSFSIQATVSPQTLISQENGFNTLHEIYDVDDSES
jgi:hypothetical protein